MTSGIRGPAVIDTGVFAARLTPSGNLLAARYRPLLAGRPAVISFVTVAELGYGARLAGWGPGKLRRLEYELARAEIRLAGAASCRGIRLAPHLVRTDRARFGPEGTRGRSLGSRAINGPLDCPAVDAAWQERPLRLSGSRLARLLSGIGVYPLDSCSV
jgi:hypothetical protein